MGVQMSRVDADHLTDECKERKKRSLMSVDGNRERADGLATGWRADALRVNAIRVDENQCKEKERKKDLLGWMGARGRVGVQRRIGHG